MTRKVAVALLVTATLLCMMAPNPRRTSTVVSAAQLRSTRPYRDLPTPRTTVAVTTTSTTAAPATTTSAAHHATNTVSRGTPRTAVSFRDTPTSAAPSAAAVDTAPVDAAEPYKPYPECMHPGDKSRDEMVRCWDPLVRRFPWPSVDTVFKKMQCESHGDPTATGVLTRAGRAHGLMQIMGGPYDPLANMTAAWSMSHHGKNWGPWEC